MHLQGVPLRLELRPRDIKLGQFVVVRRDTDGKRIAKSATVVEVVRDLLETIQSDLYKR